MTILTLWKNVNFSTFRTSCFYSLERRFLVLEYRKRHFSDQNYQKKKSLKNDHFDPLEKCQFFDFSNFLFL